MGTHRKWPAGHRFCGESSCVQFESFVILLAFFEVNVLGSIKKEWIDGTLILD